MLILAVFSTVAAALQLLFVWRVLLGLQRESETFAPPDQAPGVTVIKPLFGLESRLAENLRSWLDQTYRGPKQFIFSLQDPDDPALAVAQQLKEQYAHLDIAITVNPVRPGLTGKSSNLYYAVQLSRHPVLIFSDSDIAARSQTLAMLASAVAANPRRAQVAVPLPWQPAGSGGALMTLAVYLAVIIVWLGSASLPGRLRQATGLPGGTVALSRSALDAVGGVPAFGGHITEDLMLGRLLFSHGFDLAPGPVVDLVIGPPPPRDFWHLMVRGNRGLWGLAPLVYSLWLVVGFWHYGAILAGLLLGQPLWAWLGLGMVAARTLLLLPFMAAVRPATAWTVFYYPLFEVASLVTFLWVPLSMGRATVSWRGVSYRLTRHGLLRQENRP